jgi:hypothetical protein
MLEYIIVAIIVSGLMIFYLHRADERKRQRKMREKFRRELEAQARYHENRFNADT